MDKVTLDKYLDQHDTLMRRIGEMKGFAQVQTLVTEVPKFIETVFEAGRTAGIEAGKAMRIEDLTKQN